MRSPDNACIALPVLTSLNVVPAHPRKIMHTSGELTRLPLKLHVASFHPYSFSLVRAYTRIIT